MGTTEAIAPTSTCIRCKLAFGTSQIAFLPFVDYRGPIHVSCIRCNNCNKATATGFAVRCSFIYCPSCCMSMYQSICFDCGSAIKYDHVDETEKPAIVALGHLYHPKCFVCSTCNDRLSDKFFVDEFDRVYCKKHPPAAPGTTATPPSNDSPHSSPHPEPSPVADTPH